MREKKKSDITERKKLNLPPFLRKRGWYIPSGESNREGGKWSMAQKIPEGNTLMLDERAEEKTRKV